MLNWNARVRKAKAQKGFSLIELLIVIAIMGVLAVIAFNAFSGVLTNSKKKADVTQANNIEKAIRLLVTDTGIADLSSPSFVTMNPAGTFFTNDVTHTTVSTVATVATMPTAHVAGPFVAATIVTAAAAVPANIENLIAYMQYPIAVKDNTGKYQSFGPYMTKATELTTIATYAELYDGYKPQWDPKAGGQHVGYLIKIEKSTNNVIALPGVDGGINLTPPTAVDKIANVGEAGIYITN